MLYRRERVEILTSISGQRGLIRNPDPSVADCVKQAVDGISVIFVESAFSEYRQSVALNSSQV
jgi:hypothetical protein